MTEWRLTDRTFLISNIEKVWSDRLQNAVACKGYTSVLSKMVSMIFAVLEVSFRALTTVVKLPWKFLTLFLAVLLPFLPRDAMQARP